MIEYRIPAAKRGREPVVLIEFTRDDLESLLHLYGPQDGFTRDIRVAMRYLDILAAPDPEHDGGSNQ